MSSKAVVLNLEMNVFMDASFESKLLTGMYIPCGKVTKCDLQIVSYNVSTQSFFLFEKRERIVFHFAKLPS